LADSGRAVVVALHDVDEAARICDRVLLLFGDGQTLFGPAADVLSPANLERLYGVPHAAIEHGGRKRFFAS
jgi:iron complex transport system ATP-binding protein